MSDSGRHSAIDCCMRDIMAEGYQPPMSANERAHFRQLAERLDQELHYQSVCPMRITVDRTEAMQLVRAVKLLLQKEGG